MLQRCAGVESRQTIRIVKENIKQTKTASIFNLQLQVKNEAQTCWQLYPLKVKWSLTLCRTRKMPKNWLTAFDREESRTYLTRSHRCRCRAPNTFSKTVSNFFHFNSQLKFCIFDRPHFRWSSNHWFRGISLQSSYDVKRVEKDNFSKRVMSQLPKRKSDCMTSRKKE